MGRGCVLGGQVSHAIAFAQMRRAVCQRYKKNSIVGSVRRHLKIGNHLAKLRARA